MYELNKVTQKSIYGKMLKKIAVSKKRQNVMTQKSTLGNYIPIFSKINV